MLLTLAGCASGTVARPPATSCVRSDGPARLRAATPRHEPRAHRLARLCAGGDSKACATIAAALDATARLDKLRVAARAASPRTTNDTPDNALAAACDDRDTASCAALGERLLKDPGAERLDAPRYLHIACEGGNAASCNNLGWAYDHDFGALHDRSRAATLFERACGLGNLTGCVNRGRLARSSNSALAADYFNRACSRGTRQGCKLLAGTVEQARAACSKKAAACNDWGWLLENGVGVTNVAARDGKTGPPIAVPPRPTSGERVAAVMTTLAWPPPSPRRWERPLAKRLELPLRRVARAPAAPAG